MDECYFPNIACSVQKYQRTYMIEPANPHILKSTPFVKAYFVIHSEFASCIGTFFDFIRKGFFLKWSLEFALEYPPGILPGIIGKFRHSALNLPI